MTMAGAGADALPTPIMTVTDAQIQPCGAIAVTGSSFVPDAKLTMVLSGKTLAEHPTTDAKGSFTFNTSVPCEQRSGTVQLKASDGTNTLGVEVTIGSSDATTTIAPDTDVAPTRFDELGLWAARVVLVVVMAGELVLLVARRRRRARRLRPRTRPVSGG